MIETTMEMENAASILKLLGDQTRLTMVKMLESHDYCVCEFVAVFHASQPAISQHLRKLKDAGIVKETRKGQWMIYALNPNSPYFTLVQHILQHVPDQDYRIKELEEQGLRVSCD
nr:metalloregulator ArsR/SmtB family transcription factor [Longirhabdus pacifica]